MTTLQREGAIGAQRPRVESAPKSVRTSGDEAIELAAIAGLDLDPWQQHVLRVSLGEKADGKWSAFEVGLLCPRQNGKGAILEARELAGLFLFGERLILHSAHEMKTAVEAFLRIKFLIEQTPELNDQVAHFYQSNEKTAIELKNGSRLRFMARSGGAARGFTGDVIILDEAYNLPHETLAAVLPTMSAKSIHGNPQLWYTSSAGMESSEVLAQVRERGTSGDKALAFFDWSAPDDVSLDDRTAWSLANPGLGIRIHADFIERERAALGEAEFARERLGIWHDPRRGSVIDPAIWASIADSESQVLDPVAFAVDVSPSRDMASIALAGRRADGLFHVEVVKNQRGTGWVVDDLEKLTSRWESAGVVIDTGAAAGSLLPALDERGVPYIKVGVNEMKQACGGFFDAVVEQRLRHVDAPVLNTALAAARKRVLQDAWAWQRKDNTADITPLVATTLALWGFAHSNAKPKAPEHSGKVWAL